MQKYGTEHLFVWDEIVVPMIKSGMNYELTVKTVFCPLSYGKFNLFLGFLFLKYSLKYTKAHSKYSERPPKFQ